jgi:hypothetical protein
MSQYAGGWHVGFRLELTGRAFGTEPPDGQQDSSV